MQEQGYFVLDEQPQEQLTENQNMSSPNTQSEESQTPGYQRRSRTPNYTEPGPRPLALPVAAVEAFNDAMSSDFAEGAHQGAGVAGTVIDAVSPVLDSRRALSGTQYAGDIGEAIRRADFAEVRSLRTLRSTPLKLLPGIGSAIAVAGMVHEMHGNATALVNGDIGIVRYGWRSTGNIVVTVVSIPAPFIGVALDYVIFKGLEWSYDEVF